jgi:hypothetical protein
MILSANQPYFAPFAGFFYKAHLCDVFVILDSVQFPRGTTWITRNRFKNDQGTLWITIPVWKKGRGLQRIDEVMICREGHWERKHLASVKQAYANAPFFSAHQDDMEAIFSGRFEKLIDLNMVIIRYLVKQLAVETEVKLLSELGIKEKGDRLLIELCKHLGASTYLAQNAAKKYLDVDLFKQAGIRLRYITPRSCVYPQLWGNFLSNLSAYDLLFNCGPKSNDVLFGA